MLVDLAVDSNVSINVLYLMYKRQPTGVAPEIVEFYGGSVLWAAPRDATIMQPPLHATSTRGRTSSAHSTDHSLALCWTGSPQHAPTIALSSPTHTTASDHDACTHELPEQLCCSP